MYYNLAEITKISRFRFFYLLIPILFLVGFLLGAASPVFAAANISVSLPASGWHDPVNRIVYVDVPLTNKGDQLATGVIVTKISIGAPVTYNSVLSPAYPIAYGDIAVGAKVIRRIYLNVPVGAIFATITVTGQYYNTAGVKYSFSSGVKITIPPLPDTVSPVISISPQDGSILNQAKPQILITYSDAQSGIDAASFFAEINGLNCTSLFTVSNSQAVYQTANDFPSGNNTVKTSIKDKAGNLANAISSFIVDVTAPEISYLNPIEGSTINNGKPTMSASFSDAVSGVNASTVKIMLGLQDITAFSQITETGFSYTPAQDLANGPYTLTIDVKDKTGNNSSKTLTFIIAQIQLQITINPLTSPTNVSAQPVSGTYTGENIDSIKVNGINAVINNADKTYSAEITLSEGNNIISAVITDTAAHSTEAKAEVFLDTILPQVTIDAVTSPTNISTQAITGTYVEENIAAIKVNNVDAAVDTLSKTYSAQVILTEGENKVVVAASDLSGNTVDVQALIILDTQSPAITIISPVNDALVKQALITVQGTIDEPATVTVNGKPAVVSNGNFTAQDVAISGHEVIIKVTAVDLAGNDSEAQITVLYDVTSPKVGITSPLDSAVVNTAAVTVSGAVDDPAAAVTVNGIAAVNNAGQFTAQGVPLTEGENFITARAVDTAGNAGQQVIKITRDSTAPVVKISSPYDSAAFRAPVIDVFGTIDDINAIVTVNGVSAAIDKQGKTFTVNGINLQEGDNTITAVAVDSNGNQGNDNVTVCLDTTAPQVTITSPADGYLTRNSALELSGATDDPSAKVIVKIGNSSFNAVLDPVSLIYRADVTLQEGTNAVTVQAADLSGNAATVKAAIILDTTPPEAEILQPANNYLTRQKFVRVEGTVSEANNVTVKINTLPAVISGGNFIAENVPLSEGENTLTATVNDAVGNQSQTSVKVFLDTIPPAAVIIETPEQCVNLDRINVKGSAEAGSTVVIAGGASAVTVPANPADSAQPGAFSGQVFLNLNQMNNLQITAQDKAGNSGEARALKITHDNILPQIIITSPKDASILPASTLLVAGVVSDASGIASLSVNNNPVTPSQSGAFEYLLDLGGQGNHQITVVGYDTAQNKATGVVNVTVKTESQDTSAPVVFITAPLDKAVINQSQLPLSGTILDASSISETKVFIDDLDSGVTPAFNQGNFTAAVTLSGEGQHTIVVSAKDNLGHEGRSSSVRVTLDTLVPAKPVVNVVNPRSPVKTAGVNLFGTAEPNIKVMAKIGGVLCSNLVESSSSGNFILAVTLNKDTENTIEVYGVDLAGNVSAPAEAKVMQDSVPVNVVSCQPADNQQSIALDTKIILTFSEPVNPDTLAGNISIKNSSQQNINAGVTIGSQPQIAVITPAAALPDGQAITVSAAVGITDLAGNNLAQPFVSRFTTVDITGPAAPVLDKFLEITKETTITLTGTTESLADVAAEKNSQAVVTAQAGQDGKFSLQLPLTVDSDNAFSVVAIDTANNRGPPALIHIIQDSQAPQLAITPQDGATGTAYDAKVLFTFNEAINSLTIPQQNTATGNLRVTTTQGALNGSFSLSNDKKIVIFTPASNFSDSAMITALAGVGITDIAGNPLAQEVKSVFTVKDAVVPASPLIKEVLPSSPTKESSVTIKGTAEPQSKVGRMVEGAVNEWVDTDPVSGAFTLTAVLTLNQPNLIRLVACDKSQNLSPAAEITITSDTIASAVTNVVPASAASGIAVDSPVTLTFSEPVNPATVEANIKVTDSLEQAVSGNIVFSANNSVVTFDPGDNLTPGTVFTVTAAAAITDKAGNQMAGVFTSKFTTGGYSPREAPPKPLVTQVTPESPVKETEVTLKGSAMAGTDITVTGGLEAEAAAADANGDFTVNVSLNINQENFLLVISSNSHGASQPDTVTVVQDSLGPEIRITSPENNSIVNSTPIPVAGIASDANSVKEIKLNNVPVTFSGDYFESNVTLIEGANTITIDASDGLGNTSSQSVTVNYVKEEKDTTPPVVTITLPSPDALVGSIVNVKGTVVDASAIKDLRVNGNYCSQESGSFDAVIKLSGGRQAISVEAVDEQGIKGADSVQVTVDDMPPAKPQLDALPQITTAGSVVVKGSTDPDAAVEVDNDGAISKTQSNASGAFSRVVGLRQNQVNNLIVTASDAIGNKSEAATAQIFQDSTPLGVTSISPLSGARMVEPDSLVKIEFTKPVSEASLKIAGNFKVTAVSNGKKETVAGNVSLTPEKTLACFTPFADFPQGAEILVNLSTNIVSDQDASAHLASEFSSSFTTIPPLTSVSGMVLSSDMSPLAGATVSVAQSNLKTTVLANGGFLIERVPEGIQDIIIDGVSADLPQKFGSLTVRLNVDSGKENKLTHTVFLTPINEKSIESVPANQDKISSFNDQITGFNLAVKAGSMIFPDGKLNGEISATLIEPNSYPGRLPDGSLPEMLVMFEPKGTTIDPPASITFPNKNGLKPGEEVIIFHFTDGLHNYEEIGKGIVSQDGASIVCPDSLKSFSFIGYKLEYPQAGIRYLQGKVVDKAGAGISKVRVNALAADQENITDENGGYTIPLPSGTLNEVKVFATVSASISGAESQNVVYASEAVNPREIGATEVKDIVVDSFVISGGLRLVDKQAKIIPSAAVTSFDDKGNLRAISQEDLAGIQIMIYRKLSSGEFSQQPVIVFSPGKSAQGNRENIRFEEHIFNGPLGVEVPGEKSPVRIEPGELLRVAAYSSRTGYVGIKDITAPKEGQANRSVVCNITLNPAQVQVKVERLFYANNQRFTKIIPHGGTSLITDQLILITTAWKAGGKLLPDFAQFKLYGRLMAAVDKGLSRKQEKDLRFTIPAGESVRVLEIRGSFPDSQAIIDVVNYPGDEYLEISPERSFLTESIAPLSIAGPGGEYLSQNIRRFNFHISSDTEAQSINVWGISVSAPDETGFITVTGKSGAVEGGSLVTITNLSNGEIVMVTANADGSFTGRIRGKVGDIIQVTAEDKSGNITAPRIIEVRKIPEIINITPSLANPQETVVINGRNFSSVLLENEVRFHSATQGGEIAQVNSATSTSLTVIVPQEAVTGQVTVTVNGEISLGVMFTVTEPKIAKLEPSSAIPGESVSVTILGENTRFSAAETSKVYFGPFINVESFTVNSLSQITAQIKVSENTPIDIHPVSVTTAGKVLSYYMGFKVDYPAAAPVITKIEPEPGTPGELVTITGSGFLPGFYANKVYFNEQKAKVREASSTLLVVVIPLEFRGGTVTVKLGNLVSNSISYTVTNLGARDTIAFGQVIQGEIKHSGVTDQYNFTVDAQTAATISVERLDNLGGKGSFNPVVTLLDQEKKIVVWDDDSGSDIPPGPGKNALIKSMTLPQEGIYTIIVDASIGVENIDELVTMQGDQEKADFSKLFGVGPYKLTLTQE